MIISASRRTDIPAYYSSWFMKRMQEGFVLVRNPMNAHQVSKIELTPDALDGIVFWTKNPLPMLGVLHDLGEYCFYFQCTVTPYGQDIEPNIPSKDEIILPAIEKLAGMIGRERVVWRYDPIILNGEYTLDFHLRHFEKMAKRLKGSVRKCTFSFLDLYRNTERNGKTRDFHELTLREMHETAQGLSQIAFAYDLQLDTCAERIDLSEYGVGHAHCVDRSIFEELLGYPLTVDKDKNQRPECGCISSIDVGVYNTCPNGCLYCYANFNPGVVNASYGRHNPESPILIGELTAEDKVTKRKVESCREKQTRLF